MKIEVRTYLDILLDKIKKRLKELEFEYYFKGASGFYDFESYITYDAELDRLYRLADRQAVLKLQLGITPYSFKISEVV